MRALLTSIIITILAVGSASAQGRNRFDTTYTKKHELSVALGASMNGMVFTNGDYNTGMGPSFSIQYARVYKYNHFLRTGLNISNRSADLRHHFYLPSSPTQGDNQPDNYTSQKIGLHNRISNTYASAFIGYEYGVGIRRFRFTFGADVLMGVNTRNIRTRQDAYQETRTIDPVSGLYNYNIQYLQTGRVNGTSHNVFMALSPRIGIRRELGRRVALALTFSHQVGFSQRVSYSEKVQDTRPSLYFNPKSTWFMSQNVELRLIFKLGKKYRSITTPAF